MSSPSAYGIKQVSVKSNYNDGFFFVAFSGVFLVGFCGEGLVRSVYHMFHPKKLCLIPNSQYCAGLSLLIHSFGVVFSGCPRLLGRPPS